MKRHAKHLWIYDGKLRYPQKGSFPHMILLHTQSTYFISPHSLVPLLATRTRTTLEPNPDVSRTQSISSRLSPTRSHVTPPTSRTPASLRREGPIQTTPKPRPSPQYTAAPQLNHAPHINRRRMSRMGPCSQNPAIQATNRGRKPHPHHACSHLSRCLPLHPSKQSSQSTCQVDSQLNNRPANTPSKNLTDRHPPRLLVSPPLKPPSLK